MFPPHDEIRIKRLQTGFVTELCKDSAVHTTLFDTFDTSNKTIRKLMHLCEMAEREPCGRTG